MSHATSTEGPDSLPSPPHFNVLGSRISALTLDGTVGLLEDSISRRDRIYVSVCTVHTVVEALRRPEVRSAVNGARLATTDGMPLVWWGRLAGARLSRVYGPDLLRAILTDVRHRDTRHFFYGGAPGVTERLLEEARRLNPGLRIAGWITPPFRPLTEQEEETTATAINESGADLVWVGLGCPKQDLWMARFRPRLTAPVLVGVGAAFDFLAGAKAQAPRWVGRAGLEWLFRLMCEPRRLWRRYLVYNTVFILHGLAYATGLGRYPLTDAPARDARETR